MRRCDCGEHVPGRRLSREPGASGSPDSPDAHHIVCGQETLEYVCPLQREYHSTQHIHNSNDNDNRWGHNFEGISRRFLPLYTWLPLGDGRASLSGATGRPLVYRSTSQGAGSPRAGMYALPPAPLRLGVIRYHSLWLCSYRPIYHDSYLFATPYLLR